MDIASKVVVITGGARGIGLGLARHLAGLGAAVVINDAGVELNGAPGDPDLAQRVAEEIRKDLGRAAAAAESIALPGTADSLVSRALQDFGRLDVWFNAAAITSDRMLFNMTEEEWSRVIETNLTGTFQAMRAALRHMRQQRAGKVINLISTAGLIGNIGQANYAASKAGTFALTRVAALEMQRYGVSVNCIAPFAYTRMTESIQAATPEQEAYLERARKATVAQILPFLAYLASDESDGITGQVFGVRGNEILLFSQPRPVRSIARASGWTPETMRQILDACLRPSFTALETDLDLFQYEPL